MKKNMVKRIISGCLLLATLLTCTEWPVFSKFSEPVTVEAATHTHTDACYTGTKHSHTGSTYSGTGCYQGAYTAGTSVTCGYPKSGSSVIWPETHYSCSCTQCGAATMTIYIYYHAFDCSGCNSTIKYHQEGFEYSCSSCGYEYSYGSDSLCSYSVSHSTTSSGTYALSCGKTSGYYYDSNGVQCSAVCDKVVTNLVPTSPSQTISAGTSPDLTATATFLDGHTETVTCSVQNNSYDSSKYNTAQTVTLGYGTYKTNAKTAGPYTVNISVTIQGEFKLTVSSEDTNKGTVSNSGGNVLCNASVSIQAYPNTGYTFDGWYSGSTRVSTANPYTFNMPAADTTYVAKFTANSYTLATQSENPSYGTASGGGTIYYNASTTVTATAKTGYTFTGWYDGTTLKSASASYTFNMPASNLTLTAKFSPIAVTVSFNANGGSVGTSSKTVYYNNGYDTLPIPARDGYVFLGWFTTAGGGTRVAASTVVKNTSAHTLYAHWNQIGPSSITVVYDKTYPVLSVPKKEGYNFAGWYWDETTTGARAGENGTGKQLTDALGNPLSGQAIVKITDNDTVYAKWTPKTCNMKFDANGGSACSNKAVTYDKYVGALPKTTKSGWTFTGWYPAEIDDNGVGTPIKESDLVDFYEDTTFYAGWTQNTVSVVITYDANGGTFSNGSTQQDVVCSYPGNYLHYNPPVSGPTRPGYRFLGWTDANGSFKPGVPGAALSSAAPHTMYAMWEATATYTVTVNGTVGGSTIADLSKYATFDVSVGGVSRGNDISSYSAGGYYYGTSYSVTDITAKPGYTVTCSAPSGTITGNVTITLTITSNTYTLTLDHNGGTYNVNTISTYPVVYNGGNYNDISWGIPSRPGYIFQGWYTATGGGTAVYGANGICTKEGTYFNSSALWIYAGNATLFAQWNPETPTVYFNANGGTCTVASKTVTFEEPYGTLPKPTDEVYRDGYTFTGWYTASSGGTLVEDNTVVTTFSNHTLYAHWTPNDYSVVLEQQGATTPGTTSVDPIFGQQMPTPITLPEKKYTVTYNGNGGTPTKASETIAHVFGGYYTKGYAQGTQYYTYSGASARAWDIPKDTILYAAWTEKGTILPSATRAGYTFTGWYSDKTGGDFIGLTGEEYIPEVDTTLYAGWKVNTYTITLNANGGIVNPETLTVTYDQPYGDIPEATRTGYIFTGWYTAPSGGTKMPGADTVKITSDQTWYAHWDKTQVTLNINALYTYDAGCKEHETLIDNKGYTIATFDVYINGNLVADDVNEYNKTIAFDDTYEIKDIRANSGYLYNGVRTGYVYNGYTGKGLTGTLNEDNHDAVNGKVYVWFDFAPNTYTITPNLNGGTAPSGAPSTYSASFHQSWNTKIFVPTRTGYTFMGWYNPDKTKLLFKIDGSYNNDGTYWKDGYWHYAGNTGLHAVWSANTYSMSYDVAGNKPSASTTPTHTTPPTTATYDVAFTVANPARVGYTFLGWNISNMTTDCTHYYGSKTTTAATLANINDTSFKNLRSTAGTVKFVAQWDNNKYTVPLDQQGATIPGTTSITATFDMDMPAITAPQRNYTVTFNANTGTCGTASLVSKYAFGGYYTGTNGTGTQYYKAADYPATPASARTWNIAQNTTLYAKWTSKAVTLPTPTKTGYTFQGWYTAASGGTKIGAAGDAYTPTADIILYAQWKAKEYDVILNDRGATSINHTEKVHVIFDKKGEDIIPPKKTGYTFKGYYTGIRGSGTQYYDEMGIGIKEWKEENVSELFAYWQQNPVIVPEEEDREEPTPVPETEFEGNLGRNDAKGLLYADDYDAATGALTDLQPYLAYDTYASEGAIPGTEKLSFRAKMGTWILHYKLHRNAGIDYVRFYVTVPYRTQYERSEDEELVISPQQTKTYTFLVPKAWSYWEIKESGMYYADKVTLINPAMKNSQMEICVKNDGSSPVTAPNYDVRQYGDKTTHVFWEEYDGDKYPVLRVSFTEEQYIISDVPDALPEIDNFLRVMCLNAAWKDTRQARVRSDRFILDEHIILSDEFGNNGNGAALDEEAAKLFFDSGKIEETSYSQTYLSGIELDEFKPNGTYETLAEITYIGDTSNVGAGESVTIELTDINDIRIHTPVVCRGLITDGMEKLQSEYVLTLKDALNFFTLSVSNAGVHRMSFGYGEKDFSTALSGKSNLAGQNRNYLNQVQFPFDVYVDVGNDSKTLDGKCDPEGDYLLASGTWFTLGTGSRQFYVPVTMKNGEYPIKFRSVAVNCPISENGQYIFGEEEHQANLSPSCYVAADVIPVAVKSYLRDFRITSVDEPPAAEVLQSGCQALTLKKGYGFKYELLAQGEFYGENSQISIIPSYFWESEDGTERQEVKLYHLGEFPEDKGRVCSSWEGEPVLLRHENYDVILQQFIGNGFVPADILCVAKEFPLEEYAKKNTFTGREEFFLRDGYLMIHFDIFVYSNEGETYVFDKWQDTELYTDAKREGWNYIPGDVIRYDLSKSITDDYEIGGSE